MHINFTLPLEEPVFVFAIILFIILTTPIILNKLKIPPVIGLILAGAVIGPNGFNLLMRNSSVVLFGTVGLLYLMFLAGLEIDLNEFKKNKLKSIGFGMFTFVIPMVLGFVVFYYGLDYSWISSVLVASMFASHTLVTYPVVSKLGISQNLAVNTTIGGTVITDTLALLILAVIVGSAKGEVNTAFWLYLSIATVLFCLIVLIGFPILGRWFFKKNSDNIAQYNFVLGLVFLASFLAMLAGLEAIIGAFLAGLALNRLVPRTSPLMNRIEFVGNALFIPFFLIGVGMLIDYKVLFKGTETIKIAVIMTVLATVAKYLAAYATQKVFKFSVAERGIIFGLSNSQAAATLAAVLLGYNTILNSSEIANAALLGQVIEPIRLLSEDILNGTIVMILVTCTIASFATQQAGIEIAKKALLSNPQHSSEFEENTLIGFANESTVDELIQLTITTIDKKRNRELYGLHIITADQENAETINKATRLIETAQKITASADFKLLPLIRYDLNIVSGIVNTTKEKNINHFYIGIHKKASVTDTFFGNLTNDLLTKNASSIYIYKAVQPLSTITKFVTMIPSYAELEQGFLAWYQRIIQLAQNTGNRFEIYATKLTTAYLEKQFKNDNIVFVDFGGFDDFLTVAREITKDTMLIIGLARKDSLSYQASMDNIGQYLDKQFKGNSFLLVYPEIASKVDSDNLYTNTYLQNNLSKLKDSLDAFFS